METETNLVFVDLDNGTVADCVGAFVIDPDTANLSPNEIDVLDAADSFGSFGPDAAAIVRRVGVSVADLWAAYEWRRGMVTAGILADVEDYVVRVYGERAGDDTECEQCGERDPYVTDTMGRVCVECGYIPGGES